jgi:hypothetical protein
VLLLLQGTSEFVQMLGSRVRSQRRRRSRVDTRRRRRRGHHVTLQGQGTDMSPEWFGILLLGVLFVAIFIGFPIAFTLIAVAAIGGYAMLGPLALHLMTLQVFSVMRDPTLASVPSSCSWASCSSNRASWNGCFAAFSSRSRRCAARSTSRCS